MKSAISESKSKTTVENREILRTRNTLKLAPGIPLHLSMVAYELEMRMVVVMGPRTL
jgi:hypothetical protein